MISIFCSNLYLIFQIFTVIYITITTSQKVVDLIPFNGDVMADFRFKYLIDVVDLFVIVESKVSLQLLLFFKILNIYFQGNI